MKKTISSLFIASALIAGVTGGVQAAEKKFVNIGTAGIGGGYYPTGGFICNVLNKSRKANGHNIRCSVESTGGSVANLRSIKNGDLDVAISQADWQFHSYNGSSKFESEGANKDLRFLFSLHLDVAQMVARKEIGASSFKDLKGHVLNVGNVGSGQEASFNLAFAEYDLNQDTFFSQTTKLNSREQAAALCDGKIDAYFYTTGIGSSSITEASNSCDVSILNWMDPEIVGLIEKYSYLGSTTIPANSYKGQTEAVFSWGMPATLVASADADEEVVYQLVKAVFDNFEDFKKQSKLYRGLSREDAVRNGKSTPFHPGAQKYFEEVGLIN